MVMFKIKKAKMKSKQLFKVICNQSLSITEKAKIGPELALVEGVIPNSILSNVTYSGFHS